MLYHLYEILISILYDKFIAKKRKSIDDSCEIFIDDEFIGLVYIEDDEGEISYQFHMTILKEDLLNS